MAGYKALIITGMNVGETITAVEKKLLSSGLENARAEAQWMLAEALGMGKVEIYLHTSKALDKEIVDKLNDWLERRAKHEPLQLILGSVQFRGVRLNMRCGALIPRPETETVVGCAIQLWKERGKDLPKLALDLGTGSGCIALSLAQEIEEIFLLASDLSRDALSLAKENTVLNGLTDRIGFLVGNWLEPISGQKRLGMIIANPPYIRTKDIPRLAMEVRDFDPLLALDGGEDGCESYRRIVQEAVKRLASGGIICLECGDGEFDIVLRLLTEAGCVETGNEKDLAGSIRTAWGVAPGTKDN